MQAAPFDPNTAENNPDIEKQWAVKALDHAETYMRILKSIPGSQLRLTPLDDEIVKDFQQVFPDFNVELLDVEQLKSAAAKEVWRPWMNKYEKRVQDFNFGTLLRLDASGDYTEENTVFDIDDILAAAAAVEAAVISAGSPTGTNIDQMQSNSAVAAIITRSVRSATNSNDAAIVNLDDPEMDKPLDFAGTASPSSVIVTGGPTSSSRRQSSLPRSRRQSMSDMAVYEPVPVIHEVETPITECVCHQLISSHSVNCQRCQTTIGPLFEAKRERVQLLEQLDAHKRELQNEESKHLLALKENQKLQLRIKELEDQLDLKEDDLTTLRNDLTTLSGKLVTEVEKRAEIQAERDRISEELEELTRSLFEEANIMVADEARRRHELEEHRDSLQIELRRAQKKLEVERSVILQLNRRLSIASANTRSSSRSVSPLASRKGLEKNEQPQFSGAIKEAAGAQSVNEVIARRLHLPRRDSFTVLDLDGLTDRKLYNDFSNAFDKLLTTSFVKMFTTIPFIKQLCDDFVEPCIRLPKLSSRKIVDAILNGKLRVIEWKNQRTEQETENSENIASKSKDDPPTPPASSAESSKSASPEKSVKYTTESSNKSEDSPSKPANASSVTVGTPRSQFWFSSGSSNTGATAANNPLVCAGCARQESCEYQIAVKLPPSNSSSSLSSSLSNKLDLGFGSLSGLYLHACCRDRIQAAWEFYHFFKFLRYIRLCQEETKDTRRASNGDVLSESTTIKQTSSERTGDNSDFDDTRIERRQHSASATSATNSDPLAGSELLSADMEEFTDIDVDTINTRQLYLDLLRVLKHLFYARIGVFSYFQRLEEHEVQDNVQ